MLTADPDTLTAHDIASGATWADRYRDSDRGGSRQRYEQTRQWHFVNIELDGPNLDRACLGHRGCPRPCRHQAARRKLALLTRSSNSQPSLAIRQRLRESGFSRWSSFCISSATCTSRFMPSTTTTRVATGSRVVATGFGAGNLHHYGKSDRQIVSKSAETLGLCRGWLSQKLSHGTPAWDNCFQPKIATEQP